jgi:transcription elongation GreA/GreB family factor
MREEFDKLAASGKISTKHIEPLTTLAETRYCHHKSWGFGKITTIDTVFARFVIDFPNKPGHQMDLGFAADSLKPIPPDHILAKKASDLEGLRKLAATDHLAVVKLVLKSNGGKATVDQIQQMLVPDVIASDWKKWWDTAKRELKKDGHFQISTKKSDPIVYQEETTSLQDRLIAEFRAAKGLKARTTAATEVLKGMADMTDKAAAASEINTALNAEIATHIRTQPAVALEAMFVRDDLREASGNSPLAGELTPQAVWSQEGVRFGTIMEAVPAAKHRRALQSFKDSTPVWIEAVKGALNNSSAKLCSELAHLLVENGKFDALKDTLAALISRHTASSELLLWLAKERSDTFADILGPEVFRAMLSAMERDQFNEKKSNRLRDFIMDDQSLLVELIGSADFEIIKDLTRALQLSPVFDDMDKRSLLARIVKSYPAVQSLITGDQQRQETNLVVSWDSLERRKNEYEELVQKKIPANSKEIAIARSYGDLRENHEYKAAKEMQKVLMRRKGELEQQLVRARGMDFTNPRTDVVSIGTRVQLTDVNSSERQTYTVLGAWDGDPDKHIISYLTPVGQKLLNKAVGEEVELETENGLKKFRVESIEAAAPAPQPASAV